MAHTNSTTNYHLPQFISTDKPAWLTDVNTAYSVIDTELKTANDAASTAVSNAASALNLATTANTAATTAATAATNASQAAQAAQTAVGDASSGLTKEVNDLKAEVGDSTGGLIKDVDDLQTAVGGVNSGLTKKVNDLEITVGNNAGGLVKDVDDLQTVVGGANSGLVKAVSGLDTRVTALEQSGGGGGTFNILLCYPVGSYYETSDSNFNPNVSWGGTWQKDTAGKVTVAQDTGTFSTVGAMGGNETSAHVHSTSSHTLTINEIPSHAHTPSTSAREFVTITSGEILHSTADTYGAPDGNHHWVYADATGVLHTNASTSSVGGGAGHTHGDTGSATASTLQPYIVVNRWHRIA
jgi:uncharacterized phage infection (PIP) family protein YhgE